MRLQVMFGYSSSNTATKQATGAPLPGTSTSSTSRLKYREFNKTKLTASIPKCHTK